MKSWGGGGGWARGRYKDRHSNILLVSKGSAFADSGQKKKEGL